VLLQEYVLPDTDAAPIVAVLPLHIVDADPAFAAGFALTVTVTDAEDKQPVAVVVVDTV
jgi:hypothetical protein